MYNCQESLYDFWEAQQKKLDLLKTYASEGGVIDDKLNEVFCNYAKREITAFKKLINTQNEITSKLPKTSVKRTEVVSSENSEEIAVAFTSSFASEIFK